MAWLVRKSGRPGDPLPRAETIVRPWGAVWAIGILAAYLLLVIGGVGGLVALVSIRTGRKPDPSVIPIEMLLAIDFAAKLAAVGLLFGFLGWRREKPALVRPDPSPRASIAAGCLAAFAFLPIQVGASALQDWIYGLLGREFQAQEILVKAIEGPDAAFWAVALFAVLVAPPFEELAFRGLLHSGLRTRLGPVAASTATAFLFAVFHGNLDVVPVLFLLGLLLSWLRERTGGLTVPIAAHACYNAVQMAFVGIYRAGG